MLHFVLSEFKQSTLWASAKSTLRIVLQLGCQTVQSLFAPGSVQCIPYNASGKKDNQIIVNHTQEGIGKLDRSAGEGPQEVPNRPSPLARKRLYFADSSRN
jgi:hypothetical protein